ncbi:MAG TPA: hypothetical protein VKA50_00025 [Gammaproteobacteria bacterium]|nr:hypothetical protein [Gammaproteobacteria bacterium]
MLRSMIVLMAVTLLIAMLITLIGIFYPPFVPQLNLELEQLVHVVHGLARALTGK